MKLKFMDMWHDENGINYYTVWNKKSEELGYIQFSKEWKKWIWVQDTEIQMSEDCLKQIINKMKELR